MVTSRLRLRLPGRRPAAVIAGAPPAPASTASAESAALSWETFLDTYLPAMLLALGVGIALPAIPKLAQSFNVGFGLASQVINAFLLGGLLGSIPTGWLIDRLGRRRIMLVGPVLTAVMAFLVAVAHSFPELLVYRFFDGWAANMWLMGRLAGISGRARANQRGRQVAWMYGMDSVGRLSGPLAGGFIAASLGLRAPFVAYGIIALVTLIPVFVFTRDVAPRPRTADGAEAGAARISARALILPYLAFFGVALFASMARGPLFADLYHLYAAYAYKLSPRAIGALATTGTSVSLPIGFAAGWMIDRFGRKRMMVPGFFAVATTMGLLAVTAWLHLSFAWYVGVFLSVVVSSSLCSGSVQTIGTDVAPAEARGTFLGLWQFAGRIGSVLSPVMFGMLAGATGYTSAFLFVGTTGLITALLLAIYVPETSKL